MKTEKSSLACACVLLGLALAWAQPVRAQSTAFTYQGELKLNGSPVTGNYDLQFRLYDSNGPMGQVGPVLNVPVANGVFTVTLDFGGAAFVPCGPRWMEMDVRPAGSGAWTTLAPRTPVTPAPYAIAAYTACTVEDNAA